jgi:RecJ-like exonuclease
MITTFKTTCVCPNCDGKGKLPHYSHIANGDCFACGGTGTLKITEFIGDNSDVILEVNTRRGKFDSACLRCRTWKNEKAGDGKTYHNWGRDKWCREIVDADEARELWRNAKANGIKTTIWEY